MLSINLNNNQIKIDAPSFFKKDIKNTIFSSIIHTTSEQSANFIIGQANDNFKLFDPWNDKEQFLKKEKLIYTLEWKIVDYLIEMHSNFLQFHGASLMYNNQGFSFIGNPGTGKTSLSILLMNNDFSFLSDEVTLIDNTKKMIYPFPRNLIIKQHLLDKIQIPPEALSIEIDGDTNQKETAFFLSPDYFGQTLDNRVKIKKLFFLHNSDQQNIKINKIGHHKAFNQLLPQLFNPQFLKKEPNAITDLINETECYNLFINKPLHFNTKDIQELLTKIIDE